MEPLEQGRGAYRPAPNRFPMNQVADYILVRRPTTGERT